MGKSGIKKAEKVKIFGARVNKSLTHDTPIQADIDGFVEAFNESNNDITAYTDENADPVRKVTANSGDASGTGVFFIVRKNHYWKLSSSGDLIGHYFTPLEIESI